MERPIKKRFKRLWRQLFPTARNVNKAIEELEQEWQEIKAALKEWAKESPKVAEALKKARLL